MSAVIGSTQLVLALIIAARSDKPLAVKVRVGRAQPIREDHSDLLDAIYIGRHITDDRGDSGEMPVLHVGNASGAIFAKRCCGC